MRKVPKMRSSKKLRDGLIDLCLFLKKNNVCEIVEIGSYAGESASIFSEYFDKVTCVDMWKSFYNDLEPLAKLLSFESAEKLFDETMLRCGNIHKIKMSSEEGSSCFDDKSLQMAYIDASHKKEDFEIDLLKWVPKIKPGWFIGGHDYGTTEYLFTEVKPVVDSFFPGKPVITFDDTSWVVQL